MSLKRKYDTISQAANYSEGLDLSTMPNFGFGVGSDFMFTSPPSLNHRNRKIQYNINNYGSINVIENINIGDLLFNVQTADYSGNKEGLVFNLPLYRVFLYDVAKEVHIIKTQKQKKFYSLYNKGEDYGIYYDHILNQNSLKTSYKFEGEIVGETNLPYNYKPIKDLLTKEITEKLTQLEKDIGGDGQNFEESKDELQKLKEYINTYGDWKEKMKWAENNVNINDYIYIPSLTQKTTFLGVCNAPESSQTVGKWENTPLKKIKTELPQMFEKTRIDKKKATSSNAIWSKGEQFCVVPSENDLFYPGLVVMKFREKTGDAGGSLGKFTYIEPYIECIEAKEFACYGWLSKNKKFESAIPIKLGRVSDVLRTKKYVPSESSELDAVMTSYRKIAGANNCYLDVNYSKMVK